MTSRTILALFSVTVTVWLSNQYGQGKHKKPVRCVRDGCKPQVNNKAKFEADRVATSAVQVVASNNKR